MGDHLNSAAHNKRDHYVCNCVGACTYLFNSALLFTLPLAKIRCRFAPVSFMAKFYYFGHTYYAIFFKEIIETIAIRLDKYGTYRY